VRRASSQLRWALREEAEAVEAKLEAHREEEEAAEAENEALAAAARAEAALEVAAAEQEEVRDAPSCPFGRSTAQCPSVCTHPTQ
jgi:hypothetical protein